MTSKKQILAVFPGQGSQKVGMGQELSQSNEIAKNIFEKADKALGFPLSKLCFEGPNEDLTATHVAQPAILTTSIISYEIFKQTSQGKLTPVIAAGHSLGEYSALVAAGALSFEDAVVLVNKRGRYMQEAVPKGLGSMLAVLGKEVSEIEAAIAEVKDGIVEIANVNAPGQIVVAGEVTALNALKEVMKGSKIIELNVSAPFHCKLMQKAAENLKKDLAAINFKECAFPVISNFSAKPVRTADEIRTSLELQVCGRVRWVESMMYALSAFDPLTSVEFGAGNVLNGMMKRISSPTERLNAADNQKSIEDTAAALSA